MKFSVLIPTHNRADVLPFAIHSLLAQTETDWELFVVGDGCTDDTAEVVAQFTDPRLRWFDRPKGANFGYDNRNFAFRQMQGEFVATLPHDDIWFPDHLALLSQCLEERGAEWTCSRTIWAEPGGVLLPGDFDIAVDDFLRQQFLERKLNGIPSGCVMHRRDCFARHGYWNETLPSCGDWDMWARIIEGTRGFACVSIPTSLHFRACWRKQSNVISPLAAHPEILKQLPALQLPPGPTEQESAWLCLSRDPNWLPSVRQAVEDADRLLAERNVKGFFPQ
jgi:glycosyltransferase involved in cell wall biosynthesis